MELVRGRIGKIAITIIRYQPGVENTKSPLREVAAYMLAEFGLAGEIDWGRMTETLIDDFLAARSRLERG